MSEQIVHSLFLHRPCSNIEIKGSQLISICSPMFISCCTRLIYSLSSSQELMLRVLLPFFVCIIWFRGKSTQRKWSSRNNLVLSLTICQIHVSSTATCVCAENRSNARAWKIDKQEKAGHNFDIFTPGQDDPYGIE